MVWSAKQKLVFNFGEAPIAFIPKHVARREKADFAMQMLSNC